MKSVVCLSFILVLSIFLQSCGPRAFTKGQYSDPEEVVLLDDKYNENDMQLMANTLVESLTQYDRIKNAESQPVVMVGRVRNRTSEHIDMKMLTDKIRTALIKSGKFRFSDKEAREELAEEYEYQGSQFVDPSTATGAGKQIGVNYIITGDLSSNVQEVGKDKVIYYKLNMNLIDVATNIISWADEREVRKTYRKRSVGF